MRTYHTLDALRGIAAFSVVLLHAEIIDGTEPQFLPGAYLAVDLFFVLSGFVLEHAYGPRLARGMTAAEFFVLRVVRLWPHYALGVVIAGLGAVVLGSGALSPGGLAVAGVTGALILPSPTWAETPFTFPLNLPGWSLYFEIVINLVFALVYPMLGRAVLKLLIAGLAVAAGVIVLTHGDADLGVVWPGFGDGFVRVGVSFLVGVALCRWHRGLLRHRFVPVLQRGRTGRWLALDLPLALLPLFVARPDGRAVFDLVAILVICPAVVGLAALIEPGPRGARVFRWLGLVSFPVYAVHYPVLDVVSRTLRLLDGDAVYKPVMGLTCVGVVLFGRALVPLFDIPVRRRLSRWTRGLTGPGDRGRLTQAGRASMIARDRGQGRPERGDQG